MTLPLLLLAATTLAADPAPAPRARRLDANPIIRPDMLPGKDGQNINGPSLIRVPPWVKNPLGKYYLYFAHHGGAYIRMAYADDLAGPWKIKPGGVLRLADCPGAKGHIASPDAVIDPDARRIRLYFHGPAKAGGGQKSFVALSDDGLAFKASDEVLGIFYFRVFHWKDWWYGMAKGGLLYRSKDGLTKFEEGPNPLPGGDARGGSFNDAGPRHVALHLRPGTAAGVPDRLDVYYTSIGDAPERVLRATVTLADDWRQWKADKPVEILRPETDWEGAALPLRPSAAGAAKGRENALRDPAIFTDADGRTYLLYSVAGESGIAIAELTTEK